MREIPSDTLTYCCKVLGCCGEEKEEGLKGISIRDETWVLVDVFVCH